MLFFKVLNNDKMCVYIANIVTNVSDMRDESDRNLYAHRRLNVVHFFSGKQQCEIKLFVLASCTFFIKCLMPHSC